MLWHACLSLNTRDSLVTVQLKTIIFLNCRKTGRSFFLSVWQIDWNRQTDRWMIYKSDRWQILNSSSVLSLTAGFLVREQLGLSGSCPLILRVCWLDDGMSPTKRSIHMERKLSSRRQSCLLSRTQTLQLQQRLSVPGTYPETRSGRRCLCNTVITDIPGLLSSILTDSLWVYVKQLVSCSRVSRWGVFINQCWGGGDTITILENNYTPSDFLESNYMWENWQALKITLIILVSHWVRCTLDPVTGTFTRIVFALFIEIFSKTLVTA